MDYGIRQEGGGGGGGGHRRRKRIPRRDPLGIRAVRERPTPTHGCPYLSPNLHPFPSNASKTRAPSHHRCIRILFYPRITPSLPAPSSLCRLLKNLARRSRARRRNPPPTVLQAVSGKQAPVSAAIRRCLRLRRRTEASKRSPRKRIKEITRGKGSLM
ncbi:hypothetical protein B296_00011265 [Ensete ventricosum]|uniref:Uncharacterized protein n=1 Tax=Ensete ventricosum TaxID=4639 RepID=A0A427ACV1_ENSVE|nr:hypothetical protein B296_00011265 [Ensete ventricosum]